jgi:dimethylsulfone monooxygenase
MRDEPDNHRRFKQTQLSGLISIVTPKPRYGRPILVNATGSPAGFGYAATHSDLVFITSPAGHEIDAALVALPAHTAAIKATGAEHGRQLRTIINPMIVCRQTDRDAQLYHDSILNAADLGAIEGFVSHQRSGDAVAWKAHGDKHRALGGNIQIIGSPEHVVDKPTCKPDRRWAAPGCSARRSRR